MTCGCGGACCAPRLIRRGAADYPGAKEISDTWFDNPRTNVPTYQHMSGPPVFELQSVVIPAPPTPMPRTVSQLMLAMRPFVANMTGNAAVALAREVKRDAERADALAKKTYTQIREAWGDWGWHTIATTTKQFQQVYSELSHLQKQMDAVVWAYTHRDNPTNSLYPWFQAHPDFSMDLVTEQPPQVAFLFRNTGNAPAMHGQRPRFVTPAYVAVGSIMERVKLLQQFSESQINYFSHKAFAAFHAALETAVRAVVKVVAAVVEAGAKAAWDIGLGPALLAAGAVYLLAGQRA